MHVLQISDVDQHHRRNIHMYTFSVKRMASKSYCCFLVDFYFDHQLSRVRTADIIYAVAIRTAPVRRLVFAIRTGVRRFHGISL